MGCINCQNPGDLFLPCEHYIYILFFTDLVFVGLYSWEMSWTSGRTNHFFRWVQENPFDGRMGGSRNGGSPKWLVYFMENPIKMDDF